jgi:serine/threonine-protein kinase
MRSVGRYEIGDAIASGGMGTVHLGRARGDGGFTRAVAIKCLHPEHARDPDFASMFLDEARLSSRIRHPNVVATLDVVAEGDELFLVMEYVAGETLARLIRGPAGSRAIPLAIASSILVGTLAGLQAAHDARDPAGHSLDLVHRDVSPENIIVGIDGVPRLVDFGIAKAAGRLHATREGTVKGKLAYMAPEQIRLEKVTRLADVYAASVVLWEALTGRRLFVDEARSQLAVKILSAPVPPPSDHTPGISSELDALVLRGVARDRTRRWASAREMASELERVVPPASAAGVADWVCACAGEALERRAAALEAFERLPPAATPSVMSDVAPPATEAPPAMEVPPATQAPPAVEEKPRAHPRRVVLVGAGIAVCLGAGAVALASRRPAATEQTPAASAAVLQPSTSATVPEPDSGREPEPTPEMSSSGKPRRSAPPSRHPPQPARTTCDPPYTIEGDRKVFKRWCL